MPGTKKYTKRARNSKRSKVPLATRKYVKRCLPKVEMKQSWVHHNEVSLSTLTQGYNAPGPFIQPGSLANNRLGNIINLSGLHLKGALFNNSTSETFVRMLVVGYDGNSPTTAPANLFRGDATGSTGGISGVNGLDAMYFPVNKLDMHVYRDKVFRLAGTATGNAGANTKFFSEFIKFHGKKIEYKGSSTGLGLQNWMYSIIWISAEAADDTTTGTVVEVSMLERVYYKDA